MSGDHNANQRPIKTYHALPLALRLADLCETLSGISDAYDEHAYRDAAAELRRQHAEIEALREALRKAVNRQGFSNEELILARAALAQGEKT